jgi:anti-sigma B factor antagonist
LANAQVSTTGAAALCFYPWLGWPHLERCFVRLGGFVVIRRDAGRAPAGLHLARLPGDPTPVLVVTGEVDVYEAPAFRAELFALVEQGHARVVVDCSGLAFLDSAGLAAFVDAQRRLATREGELVLRNLRPSTRRIFEITDLVELFSFETAS